MLRLHRTPPALAEKLVPVGEALARQAAELQLERAASFDLDTGLPVGPLRSGRENEVDVREQLAAMVADRRYIALHTHRLGTAFSDSDLALLLANPPLHVIVAIGHGGGWHLLSKQPETRGVPVPAALTAIQMSFRRVATPYLALARSGSISRERTRYAMRCTCFGSSSHPTLACGMIGVRR